MPSYVYKSGSPTTITSGTNVYLYTSTTTTTRVNYIKVYNGTDWVQVYQWDTTGPSVPTPTVVQATLGTSSTVSWGAITDTGSGVASATLYQTFIGSTSGFVSGSTYSIPSGAFSGGSTTMNIPTNRRYTQFNEIWQVSYYIIATDNVGNSTTGNGSIYAYNKPYGSFAYIPSSANSFSTNWASPALTQEGIVRRSSTWAYGAWFYGSNIPNDCLGFAPDSGKILIVTAGPGDPFQGNSGTFSLRLHNLASGSGSATPSGTTLTQYLTASTTSADPNLPSDWLTAFGNATAKGVMLTDHSNQPGYLRGNSNFSGTITITFN